MGTEQVKRVLNTYSSYWYNTVNLKQILLSLSFFVYINISSVEWRENLSVPSYQCRNVINKIFASLLSYTNINISLVYTVLPLKRGLICYPETSVTNYQPLLCNIPQGQRPQLHCSRSLKSCICALVSSLLFWVHLQKFIPKTLDAIAFSKEQQTSFLMTSFANQAVTYNSSVLL